MKKLWALFFVVLCVSLQAGPFVQAQTITQGYDIKTDVSIQKGMIVGLVKDDAKRVEPINNTSLDRLHGVVVGGSEASFVLAEETQKIYVASGGKFEVLVSDQNGPIAQGDLIAVSPVTGIGMKSDELQPIILGKAIDPYDGTKNKLSDAFIKDAQGNDKNIAIGRVLVDISIGKNPRLKTTTNLPGFLKNASELIAGKPVNPLRVYLALGVLLVSACIAGALIYSGIRSSMIAIGRNPLSKKSILRGLMQVIIVAMIIFVTGVFGVYLLVKL
jgi:hypothetical protein